MTECPHGHPVSATTAFCGTCGADVRPRCPEGHANPPGSLACATCGLAMSANEPTALTSDAGGEGSLMVDVSEAANEQPPTPVATPPPPPSAPTWAPPPSPPPAPPAPAVDPRQRLQPPAPAPVGAAGSAGPAREAFQLDLARLSIADRVIAVANVVLFFSLFLPWYGVPGYSQSGIGSHGYLALVLILCLVMVAYLTARAGWSRLPVSLPFAHAPLLLVVGLGQLLLVFIAFLQVPYSGSVDRKLGLFLALIAALVAALTIIVPIARSSQRVRR